MRAPERAAAGDGTRVTVSRTGARVVYAARVAKELLKKDACTVANNGHNVFDLHLELMEHRKQAGMPRFRMSALVGVLLCVAGLFAIPGKIYPNPTPTPTPGRPIGVYSLGQTNVAASANVLSNTEVDGISIRVGWDNLEIADGIYDWSFLDSEIGRAAAAGKKAIVRVSDGGTNMPSWVMTGVITTYTFQTSNPWQPAATFRIPVFWDAYYTSKKNAMIAALGPRYNSNPTVTAFVVGVANAYSADWYVPHRQVIDPPFTNSEVNRWLAAGYTTQKLIGSANGFINAAMAAFPNKTVAFSINPNGTLDANPTTACTAVASASR